MPDRQEIQDAFAEKTRATLAPFGIALENPCDLSQLYEIITKLTEDFLKEMDDNLKAALSYAGAYNWGDFRMNAKQIRISSASWSESQTFVI